MTISFFDQVYRVVQCIPPGQVATYGQIARLLGQPRAARTVGWALHSLPSDVEAPWQRVINARGEVSLGIGRQGAEIQRTLLEAEGVDFDDRGRVDLKVYGWPGLSPPEVMQLLADEGPQGA